MSKRNGKLSLKVTDFSDRELLAIVADSDREGWTDIGDVAEAIWPRSGRDPDTAFHARMCVAGRFRYMKAIGLLERNPDQGGLWRLTELGEVFVYADLRAAQVRAIEEADAGQELALAGLLGDLYQRTSEEAAALIRREFQFRTYQRRWG